MCPSWRWKRSYIARPHPQTFEPYDKIYNGKNTVTSGTHYSYSNGKYSIKTALPTALYNKGVSLGYGASTTSVAIHYTVEAWLADRGITVDHTSLYIPFGTNVQR